MRPPGSLFIDPGFERVGWRDREAATVQYPEPGARRLGIPTRRVMTTLILLAALATATVEGPRPGPWPPLTYPCLRADSPIDIDGRLEDPSWRAAPWTDVFVDIEGDRRPAPRHRTQAKMLWDDETFYVAAQLEEPHLWATLRTRDSVIYYDNDFEVFLDPDGDSHLYTEIEVNALNTVWDLLLVRPYRDGGPAVHAWDIPGLRTAVHLDGTLNDPSDRDRGWSVEIAIPFAVLAETTSAACPPRPGDRWRVNFSRVQWRLTVDDGEYRKTLDDQTGTSLPEDNWVWSPQREIAMHEPEHWGVVEFREADAAMVVQPDPREWHLRYASYLLAEHRRDHGSYPATFVMPTPTDAPRLDEGIGPLEYRSDGTRYTLRLGSAQLTEDGRFSTTSPD